jgi:ectoine hydroxylase-related dioxygenase (phytanoyl-CoA dioxygenase family)
VPGSHNLVGQPSDYGYDSVEPHQDEELLEAPKGTILIYSAHLWHGGTKCMNGKPRRQIFINYRDRKVWQSLNMKKFLYPEFIASLNDSEKYLLKVRPEDGFQSEWLFKRRNQWLIKKLAERWWVFKDKKYT